MSGTSPDSVSYPSQPYGLLGPYPWQTINVQDYLATGDGVTDDGPRFQLALDALEAAGGGVLIIPPAPSGTYLIGQCLRHPSYVDIRGSGGAAVLTRAADFAESSDYGGSSMWLNLHAEADETEFTGYRDFQISFDNVWFNNTTETNLGAAHAIFHRAVNGVKITNCRFLSGADGTAAVTCNDHLVQGCTAIEQVNCCYDHWGGSTNCRVIGCYGRVAETSTNQIVNFNAVRTGGGTGPTESWRSVGFILSDCILVGPTTAQRSINFEPLGEFCSVSDVLMIGNRCYNARVIMSSNTAGVQIIGNVFSNSTGNSQTIWSRQFYGIDADNITIANNHFIDCNSPANQGLIDTTATNTRVYGNAATGGTYDYGVVYRGVTGEGMANSFPDAVINPTSGNFGAGSDIRLTNEQSLEFLATNDHRPYFKMNVNSLFLVTTTAANGPRSVWSIATASDSAQFVIYPNVVMSGIVRNGYAEGLVAEGSSASDPLALTEQNNVVATTAAGTGVRLPTPTGGGVTISVYNDGANTLNVYPPAAGQINGGGVNIPATVAAGASGRWTSISTSQYRTAA